jgi:hypothetical protein
MVEISKRNKIKKAFIMSITMIIKEEFYGTS